jgi:GNAT superfamily N-acetyltransferase
VTEPLDWREAPIGRHHDRKAFDCGSPELNEYIDRYARQNHESGGAKTFVAVPPVEPARVLGYYSISPGAIEFAHVPAGITKKLGRYEVPVFRLGRLAVSLTVQGRGLGAELLLAAGIRALLVAAQIGGVALAIDAKDARAARWYESFGAVQLLDDPLKLILPLRVIADTVKAVEKRDSRS